MGKKEEVGPGAPGGVQAQQEPGLSPALPCSWVLQRGEQKKQAKWG